MMEKGSKIVTFNGVDTRGISLEKAENLEKKLTKKGYSVKIFFLKNFKCKVVAQKA